MMTAIMVASTAMSGKRLHRHHQLNVFPMSGPHPTSTCWQCLFGYSISRVLNHWDFWVALQDPVVKGSMLAHAFLDNNRIQPSCQTTTYCSLVCWHQAVCCQSVVISCLCGSAQESFSWACIHRHSDLRPLDAVIVAYPITTRGGSFPRSAFP